MAICVECKQSIEDGAKRCNHCSASQNSVLNLLGRVSAITGVVIALLSGGLFLWEQARKASAIISPNINIDILSLEASQNDLKLEIYNSSDGPVWIDSVNLASHQVTEKRTHIREARINVGHLLGPEEFMTSEDGANGRKKQLGIEFMWRVPPEEWTRFTPGFESCYGMVFAEATSDFWLSTPYFSERATPKPHLAEGVATVKYLYVNSKRWEERDVNVFGALVRYPGFCDPDE